MIPHRTVEQILDAARIEDVIGDFVTLKRRGTSLIACCPFHNEKTPSFIVTPSKGLYKCFGCGKGGTAVNFVMEHENLTYPEALKYLAKKYNIEVVEREETAEDIAARQKGESLLLASEFAGKFFASQLGTPEGQVGYGYFKSRGLEDSTIQNFGLGWAPAGRARLQEAAHAAGYKDEYLVDTGLCFRTEDGKVLDRFYNRVVFPIHNVNGRVIAFGCRTLSSDKTVAKYVNSPETEIYSKRNVLYGMFQAKNEAHKQDKFILVEGYLDVITMHQLGICNVAASSGTSLTVEQVKLIKRFTDNVTIIYDGDPAGIHAALRGIGLVLEGGLNVKVVLLPDGDDPDSFGRKHTKEEVLDFIKNNEQDFIGFKTRFLLDDAGNDPIKRAGLINDIADTIALIPDPIKRNVYASYAAGELTISEQLLFERINKTRARMLEEKKRAMERERQQKEEHGGAIGSDAANAPFPTEEPPYEGGGEDFVEGDGWSGIPLKDNTPAETKALDSCEKELLGFILSSGSTPLVFDVDSPYYKKDGDPLTVAQFIDAVLREDEGEFANEALRSTYRRYFELQGQGLTQEQICVRLLSDDDSAISATARSILEEKHQITVRRFEAALTNEGTALTMFVPRALLAYNKAKVELQLKKLTLGLRDDPDPERTMNMIMSLNNIKKELSTALGRV